jgi:hypothetical protein
MAMRKIEVTQAQEDDKLPSISPVLPTDTSSPTATTPLKEPSISSKEATKTVEIKLALPSLPKLPQYAQIKRRVPRIRFTKKAVILGGVACAVAMVSYGGYYLYAESKTAYDPTKEVVSQNLIAGSPDYSTVLPKGKDIKSMGGWTRVSPPDRNPVYAYVDHIGNAQINVSQQPLPEDFKKDTAEQVEYLARTYSANEKISVGKTTVYVGTSARGPQSVIFTKDDALILIKSTVKISNDQWAAYVDSLR